MKYLEQHGAKIPALGLGTWCLSGDQCTNIVSAALRQGYRHVDTAIMYENEAAVGAGLRASGLARDDYFLTTKVWPTDVRDGVFESAVEASLKRLGVDQVDMLLIHWPPKVGDVPQWARLINEAADRGWTRHIGVSNFTVSQLEQMIDASARPIVCNQVENHPYLDQRKMRVACLRLEVAMIAYCPLFRGGDLFEEPAVRAASEWHAKSPAQIVLRWHMQHEGAGAIPKTATPSRLAENADIFDFELSEDEMAAINTLRSRHERICDFEFSPDWDAP